MNHNQQRNISLYTSSLPKYFKTFFTPHSNYEYYCEDCCCPNSGLKPAYSSLELCHVNDAKPQKFHYSSRTPYFRSHSLETPYSYKHKEIAAQERIEEYEMNSSGFEEAESGSEQAPPGNIPNKPLSYTEDNLNVEHLDSGSEKCQPERTNLPNNPTNSSFQPRTRSHPRVTFVLSENSEGESRRNSPSPKVAKVAAQKSQMNGKTKAYSDGEEDTTISSSESTSSIVEQKFQSYFRNNSLTRAEKRFKRTKI